MKNEQVENIRRLAINTADTLEKYVSGQLITNPRRLSKELIRYQAMILDELTTLEEQLEQKKRGPKPKEETETEHSGVI